MQYSKYIVLGTAFAILSIAISLALSFDTISAGDRAGAASLKSNTRSGLWSDPGIWTGGRVPASGDSVTVVRGTKITYDVASEAEIAELAVEGSLVFSRRIDTNLDVGDVFVRRGGYLEIGAAHNPVPAGVKASVRFVNSSDGEHALQVMGEAQIHGQPLAHVYTTLAGTARKRSSTLRVRDLVDWAPGDRIVVTSTTQNPRQSEENVIDSVDGRTLLLARPLRFRHDGEGPARAHVALLTRNVVITSKDPNLRGHTLFLEGARGSISYAEYRNLGAKGQLGKYPIHFHEVGETMKGGYVKGASVWNSGNRFITVHSTQYVTLIENVGYNAMGHGFFLEKGDEVFVTLDRNLGIGVKPGRILRSDMSPAVFWVQNPHNTLTNNIGVASVRGSGFEFAIPRGKRDIPALGGVVEPRKLSLLKFEGNEAYSNSRFGVRVYRFNTPKGHTSDLVGLKVWRNHRAGLSLVGSRMRVSGASLFGNGMVNVSLLGNSNLLQESTVLGELDSGSAKTQRAYPPAARGLVLGGRGNTVSKARFKGHVSRRGVTGSDISLDQGHDRPVTALVSDSVMASGRPIIFGYPINEASSLEVRGYQGNAGDNFSLSRIDVAPPGLCPDAELDMVFLARKCPG